MSTNSELIFSKELDQNIFVECFVSDDNNNFIWEFKIKGKENKTIDKFKIDKQKLKEFSQFSNRSNFYRQFKVISVFKNHDNLVFLLDKFGQVDVQIYTLMSLSKTIIPIKKYQLSPMDTEILGEDFQDVKMVSNTIYTLSKHLRGNNGMYYISMIDLDNKTVQESLVNVFEKEFIEHHDHQKTVVQLEDSSYQSTGFGFKFSLLNNNYLEVEKNNLPYFIKKNNFGPSIIDKTKNINNIMVVCP